MVPLKLLGEAGIKEEEDEEADKEESKDGNAGSGGILRLFDIPFF